MHWKKCARAHTHTGCSNRNNNSGNTIIRKISVAHPVYKYNLRYIIWNRQLFGQTSAFTLFKLYVIICIGTHALCTGIPVYTLYLYLVLIYVISFFFLNFKSETFTSITKFLPLYVHPELIYMYNMYAERQYIYFAWFHKSLVIIYTRVYNMM